MCVNSTTKRCPNKIIKTFQFEDFFFATGVNDDNRWCTLSCEYLCEVLKKFETAIMGYSGACRKLVQEKNLKLKISWHCPFKLAQIQDLIQSASVPHSPSCRD